MRQATKYEPNNKKKYKNHAHAKNRKKIEQNKIISLIHVKTKLEPVICKSFCSTLKIKFMNYVHKKTPSLQMPGPNTRPTMEGVFSIYKKALGLALGSF